MRHLIGKALLILALLAAGVAWNGKIQQSSTNSFFTTAEARIGRPATPVSYAGVARRTTVRVATPGVGTPANRGGPVNRVGRR
ncbi:MAG: hypothetical protein U9P36_12695 [Thermodesulfobacteriota bacterium]|nr:hypothetical protein [Thermodesulfobacteriota bacterium]